MEENRTTSIITEETASTLYPYQINKIEMLVRDMQAQNKAAQEWSFDECPKCPGPYTWRQIKLR